ncbi:c-type cytochrome [Chitinophaga pinensis]|uniref:Cytochrome c n=1 Tax=Chitinophaga pinensis TaxID=79329 RepID=A0A5C6LLL5_9BACT|nr:c-type cytochrome [Chitinophaga pinensis]TWV94348.1 cytochrome c [Chitinophaga pinensis]TWV97413.1 cytochrome c [Chitinophaga pinensis]
MQSIRIVLFFLLCLLLTSAFTAPAEEGRTLYDHHCARCHGTDGTRGLLGAKNLQKSQLSDSAIFIQISNGRRIMPAFKKRMNPDQMTAIANYIKSFRKL